MTRMVLGTTEQPPEAFRGGRITFADGKMWIADPKDKGKGMELHFVRPTKTPNEIDMTPPKSKIVFRALYDLKVDTLSLIISETNGKRPEAVDATKTGRLIYVLKKVQR